MSQDKLLMNDAKIELLLIGTRQELAKVTIDIISIGRSVIAPQFPIRNLGVQLDSNLSMGDRVTKTTCGAFHYLYNIKRIRNVLKLRCMPLLFQYYVILPYKIKRTRKIRGRNTL